MVFISGLKAKEDLNKMEAELHQGIEELNHNKSLNNENHWRVRLLVWSLNDHFWTVNGTI